MTELLAKTDAHAETPQFASDRGRIYPFLVAVFASLLLISNVAATQPVEFRFGGSFSLILDGAFVLFPFAYVMGDVLSEVYGFKATRHAVYTGFGIAFAAMLYFQLVIALPKTEGWDDSAFVTLLGMSAPQMLFAGLAGFIVGQTLNSWTLVLIKQRTRERFLWARLMGSTVVGELGDTVVFCLIAAPIIGLTTAGDIANYIVVGVIWKILVEACCLPITYPAIAWVKRHEPSYGPLAA